MERVKIVGRDSQDLSIDDLGPIQLSTIVKCQTLLQLRIHSGHVLLPGLFLIVSETRRYLFHTAGGMITAD